MSVQSEDTRTAGQILAAQTQAEAANLASLASRASDVSGSFTPHEGNDARGEEISNGAVHDGTTAAVALTTDDRINGILSLVRWNQSVVTYSFPNASTDYEGSYPGNAPNESFGELTAAQRAVYHNALNTSNVVDGAGGGLFSSAEGFTNQNFQYNLDDANANMRAAYSTDAGGSAYAYYPGGSFYNGDAWYDPTSFRNYQSPVLGGDAYRSTIHEIGHQLGLKHAHEASNGNTIIVPNDYNSHEYTVMTYRSYVGHPGSGGYTNETFGHPQSWMMLDIAALQHMYGADFDHNGTSTTYTWSTTTGEMFVNGVGQGAPGANRIFLTIWDGNGTDLFDLSNYTSNLEIDLSPGAYSDFNSGQSAYLGGGPNSGYARGNVFNSLLFGGDERSLIENVYGGSGNDNIYGNNAANYLWGNTGGDSLNGGAGSDTLDGSAGNDSLKGSGGADYLYGGADTDTLKGGGDADYLHGGAGRDLVTYDDSSVGVSVTLEGGGVGGTAQGDTLVAIEDVYGSDYGDSIVGSAAANSLRGNGGADSLYGGGDRDDLYGGEGADQHYGGSGTDYARYDDRNYGDLLISMVNPLASTGAAAGDTFSEVEGIVGGVGNDTIIANGSANILYGLQGADHLFGGLGADIMDGGAGYDYARYDDADYGNLRISLANPAINTGAAAGDTYISIEGLVGGISNDTIVGNDGANILYGLHGADHIYGGLGADIHNGGAGFDYARYDDANYGNLRISLVNPAINTGAANGDTYISIEGVVGGVGNDTIVGSDVANILHGLSGNDHLYGGLGADVHNGGDGFDYARYDDANYGNLTISLGFPGGNTGAAAGDTYNDIEGVVGGVGNDNIIGNNAANTLYGLTGNDTLSGGLGADVLDLGIGGADQVRFNTALGGGNIDTVHNFVAADDTVLLSKSIFTAFATIGSLSAIAPGAFNTGAAATELDDRIIYNAANGALIYDVNGSNGGGATQFATLSAGLTLTAADFYIVA